MEERDRVEGFGLRCLLGVLVWVWASWDVRIGRPLWRLLIAECGMYGSVGGNLERMSREMDGD